MTERVVGSPQHRDRIIRTVIGFLLAGAGIFTFLKQPEHGQTIGLLLVGVGCGMIEPSLVSRIFKQP